jgi:dihydrodipicolinate synthase/N-acetylneuraminate lyase
VSKFPQLPQSVSQVLYEGLVIPAMPLALTRDRTLDETRQRALIRYYHAAGAGGLAVGVHTTQFQIRDEEYGLFETVLSVASETISSCDRSSEHPMVKVAGICGETKQAVKEAIFARENSYHLGLLSLSAMKRHDEEELIAHCKRVAQEIPLMGFYLQPAVGGRLLPLSFWRRFVEIPNVAAIKIAPFNRYQTLDVIRAVAETGREDEIALYTGNDDNIVVDLLTAYNISTSNGSVQVRIVGGLLGHWACWTQRAVELLERCKRERLQKHLSTEMLTLAAQVTDCNAAFFDAANHFAGSIPGIHEVLRRQGLMENNYCLDLNEVLSPGQNEEIDRVYQAYPHLNDDDFIKENLERWMSG